MITVASLPVAVPPVGPASDRRRRGDAGAAQITIDSTSPAWTRRVEWGLEPLPRRRSDAAADGDQRPRRRRAVRRQQRALPADRSRRRSTSARRATRDSRPARLITLHELAHAWAETQLSGRAAGRVPRLRRARRPGSIRGSRRHEWGAEHAAEVVSWGLMDEMVPIIRIYDAEPAQLSVAFDLLVGRPPLWAGGLTGP